MDVKEIYELLEQIETCFNPQSLEHCKGLLYLSFCANQFAKDDTELLERINNLIVRIPSTNEDSSRENPTPVILQDVHNGGPDCCECGSGPAHCPPLIGPNEIIRSMISWGPRRLFFNN